MLTLLAAKEISHREFRGLCHKKQNQRWYPRLATVLLIYSRPPEETEKQPKEKS